MSIWLAVLTLGFLHANDGDKMYCISDQIEITESAICVHLDDEVFEIDQLHSDHQGLFFFAQDLRYPYPPRKTVNPKNTCER